MVAIAPCKQNIQSQTKDIYRDPNQDQMKPQASSKYRQPFDLINRMILTGDFWQHGYLIFYLYLIDTVE